MRRLILAATFCCLFLPGVAQNSKPAQNPDRQVDRDRDGLSDAFENSLLIQFEPHFMVSRKDCSVKPARFAPGVAVPTAVADDGAIYGQAFPHETGPGSEAEIELHFYHLWRRDCGRLGHPLDAEHVSVLLRGVGEDPAQWKAVYWYASAHEGTVCDASQITRASTVDAVLHGAVVWISAGKHASFFSEELCGHGCGGDRCIDPQFLNAAAPVDIGETSAPINGAVWLNSPDWPLAKKMGRSDFTEERIERLEHLPATDVAWANPSKRPAQAAILSGNATINGLLTGEGATADGLALSNRRTDTAIVLAGSKTDGALSTSAQKTGNALTRSYRNLRKAMESTVHHSSGTHKNPPEKNSHPE
jgi:hypothetical protein